MLRLEVPVALAIILKALQNSSSSDRVVCFPLTTTDHFLTIVTVWPRGGLHRFGVSDETISMLRLSVPPEGAKQITRQ